MSRIRRALVTGASQGIGAAVARDLAVRGVEVWLAARRRDVLQARVDEIRQVGGVAHALCLDVSDAAQTVSTIRRLDEQVGGLDLVVANAGIAGPAAGKPVSDSTWSELDRIAQVNFRGAAATLTALIPAMRGRGFGHLAATSSMAVLTPNPRTAIYGATKAGLDYFVRCLDIELRPVGIRTTLIHPGFVATAAAAGLGDPLPLVWSTSRAARRIGRGLIAGAREIRFPRLLHALAWCIARLPAPIYDPLIRFLTCPKGQ